MDRSVIVDLIARLELIDTVIAERKREMAQRAAERSLRAIEPVDCECAPPSLAERLAVVFGRTTAPSSVCCA